MSDAEPVPVIERKGKPWTEEEDRLLYDRFIDRQTIESLVLMHQRTVGGIRSRLQKLRLIDRFGEVTDPPPRFWVRVRRRAAKAPAPAEADDELRPVFSMTAPDGWQVEIQSNRVLDKGQAERLAWILRGAAKPPVPASQ
jgi:hypothetical protein